MRIPIFDSPLPQRFSKIVHVLLLNLIFVLSVESIVLAQNSGDTPNPDSVIDEIDTGEIDTHKINTGEPENNTDMFNAIYLPFISQLNSNAAQSTEIIVDTSDDMLDPLLNNTPDNRIPNNLSDSSETQADEYEQLTIEMACADIDSCTNQLYLPWVADSTGNLDAEATETAPNDPLLPSAGPQLPVVNAGADQTITLADPALLRPRVTDDGLPAGLADLSATWSQVSGPAPVLFDNHKEMLTVARFSALGSYTLRLTVRDGSQSAQDQIRIIVTATHAITLRVPQEYATIQAAINAAPAGALVLVSPGTYTESLVIAKTLTVASTFYTTKDASLINQTVIRGTSPDIDAIGITSAAGLETQIVGFRVIGGKDGIDSRGHIKIRHNHVVSSATDCINYANDKAGLVESNILEGGGDDGVDLNDSEVIIQKNIIHANQGDGIEMRIKNHTNTLWNVIFRDNEITENIRDGIQIIDEDTTVPTASRVVIERNLIASNIQAGIGFLDNAVTSEDYRAASLLERVILLNNTIVGSNHGVSGGDNLTGANNIFANHSHTAVKRIDGQSKLFYSMFWNNGSNNNGSILDAATTFSANPNFRLKYRLATNSPAVNVGTAGLTLPNGEVIVNIPPGNFAGNAPDLGRYENDLVNILESRIAIGSDDAEQRATGGIDLSSTDLELVFDRSNQTVGLRFNALFIPKAVTITNAYIQFKTDEVQSDAITLTVQGQASNQATTFMTTTFNISSRLRTTASTAWSPAPWLTVGEAGANQRTPNLAPIIQEIINRPGWASGNSIAILITGSGHRTATAFEANPASAPLLHIEYTFN